MNIVEKTLDKLAGYERVTLQETERMLVLDEGRFAAILGAGRHRVKVKDSLREVHTIDQLRFVSPYDRALFRHRPDLAQAHLLEVRTGPEELVLVTRDGRPLEVRMPDSRVVYWKDAGEWAFETFQLSEGLQVPGALLSRLTAAGVTAGLTQVTVAEGHVGLLSVDGKPSGQLQPGVHGFWKAGRALSLKQVDLRMRTHEVLGQEILTKDRVTLRVNLTAQFRVVDAEVAVTKVKDFEEALHKALQLAFRKTLGALTLDRLLAEKVTVDAEAAEKVRAEMSGLGLEVGEIALKDVILPGEMRDILNKVVTAEKEAEANVIRRREETNATRALLNTAKVMAENPVMLRLKELEALEKVAGKVERLTVHNGSKGLLSDLVSLKE